MIDKRLSDKIRLFSIGLSFLIVILHSNMASISSGCVKYIQQTITEELARIAVPLFFMISGFLFFQDYDHSFHFYCKKTKNRTISLFVPYIIFVILGSFVFYLMSHEYTFSRFFHILKESLIYSPKIFYPLWFLRDLYILVLVSPIIAFVCRKVPFFFILPLADWLSGKNSLMIISTESILFFFIGSFIVLRNISLQYNIKKIYKIFLLITWITGIAVIGIINSMDFSRPYFVHCVLLLVGLLAVWLSYDEIPDNYIQFLIHKDIVKYSFFIYLIHEPTLLIVKKSFWAIGFTSNIGIFWVYIVAPIITFFVVYFLGKILKRNIPQLFGIITGNRI